MKMRVTNRLLEGGDTIKRLVSDFRLAQKWQKLGYKIVALSYWGCFGDNPMTYHLEKRL